MTSKKTEIKQQKYSKAGLAKLLINTLFFASILSFIVAFVGEYINNLYGTSILHGMGVIIFGISWLLWMSSTSKDGYNNIKLVMAITLLIAAPSLMPSILTFSMSGTSIIIISLFPILKIKYLD